MYRSKRPEGLKGEEGLTAAVIAQAVKDASSNGRVSPAVRVDARRYFAGPEYTWHLELLGLPPNYLPQEFENETD